MTQTPTTTTSRTGQGSQRSGERLVVPYTLVVNDAHFVLAPTFATPDDFFLAGKAALDRLRDDGDDQARMMSVGIHARMSGQQGGLQPLSAYWHLLLQLDDVWVATEPRNREDLATQVPAAATSKSNGRVP